MSEQAKRVSWLELFYDLVFVALVAQLTYAVADHHKTLLDLFTVGIIGYMIFIAWIGTTVNRNLVDEDTNKDKILIQLQMVFAFLMSISLPGMFEGNVLPFFLSFVLVRAVQLFMTHTYYEKYPDRAPKRRNVFWGMVIATVLWGIAGFAIFPYAYIIAGCALLIDILSPLTHTAGNQTVFLNLGHLQERLGLFLILVIGESMLVVALANTVASSGIVRPLIVLSGITLMIALWWTYFGFLEGCKERTRPKNMMMYLHAHAFLFGGVVLLAAAYKNFLKHESLVVTDLLLLTAGVMLVGCMSILIRSLFENELKLRTGAMRALAVGTPVVGYVGYLSGEVTFSIAAMTLFVIGIAIFDEKRRQKCFE